MRICGITHWELASLLFKRGTAYILRDSKKYILQSVERESGDGMSFNLRVLDAETGERQDWICRIRD